MKSIKIPDETFELMAWLVRQDVTLPAVMVDYLKWDKYTKEEIRAHFHVFNDACIKSREKQPTE